MGFEPTLEEYYEYRYSYSSSPTPRGCLQTVSATESCYRFGIRTRLSDPKGTASYPCSPDELLDPIGSVTFYNTNILHIQKKVKRQVQLTREKPAASCR